MIMQQVSGCIVSGRNPCLPPAEKYIGESLHVVLEYTRHVSLTGRCWNINIGEGNIQLDVLDSS